VNHRRWVVFYGNDGNLLVVAAKTKAWVMNSNSGVMNVYGSGSAYTHAGVSNLTDYASYAYR